MNRGKMIKIPVSLWSETEKSWYLLTKMIYQDGRRVGATDGHWFPKSICQLEKEGEESFLLCPEWLLIKNNIEYPKDF